MNFTQKNLLIFVVVTCFFTFIFFVMPNYMSAEKKDVKTKQVKVDDFEDENFIDELGGTWKLSSMGGKCAKEPIATISIVKGKGGSKGAVKLDYTRGTGCEWQAVNMGTEYPVLQNLEKKYKAISFWIRGDGHKMRLVFISDNITTYNFWGYIIMATPKKWTEYKIPFIALAPGWGNGEFPRDACLKCVKKIEFGPEPTDGEKGWFEIDNVMFIKK